MRRHARGGVFVRGSAIPNVFFSRLMRARFGYKIRTCLVAICVLAWPGTYAVATHSSRPIEALWDCYLPSGPAYQRTAVGVSSPDECVSSFAAYFESVYIEAASVTGSLASEGDPFIFSATYSYRVEYNVTLTVPSLGINAQFPGYAFTTAFSPKPYTIKLAALASTSGSSTVLTSVEPNKATGLVAYVYDQNGQSISGVKVKLEVDVVPNSGGHQHHDNRPKGTLGGGQPAGPDAITGDTATAGFAFSFTAPLIAGDHKLKATCTDRTCTLQGPDTVWVGVKGLVPIPDASTVYLLENRDGQHPNNHYLTREAEDRLLRLADLYHQRFPTDPVLYLNDASLERGGLFDIYYNFADANGVQHERNAEGWWKPPHKEHRRGTVIDIRANGAKGSIPVDDERFEAFEKMAKRFGAIAEIHSPRTSNQHYHVRLMGVAE